MTIVDIESALTGSRGDGARTGPSGGRIGLVSVSVDILISLMTGGWMFQGMD